MQLSPLGPPQTAVDAAADRLRAAIVGGEVAAGSRLPAERALATQLGVTRVTVRGALHKLAADGLLIARQGQGHTVQDFRRAGGPRLLATVARQARAEGRLAQVVADALSVRRQLTMAVLVRLAEVRPDAGPFIAAVDDFEAALQAGGGPDTLAQADAAVVAALLQATGSPVFGLCLHPIVDGLASLPELRAALFVQPAANLLGWRAVAAWLQDPAAHDPQWLLALLAERDVHTVAQLEARP